MTICGALVIQARLPAKLLASAADVGHGTEYVARRSGALLDRMLGGQPHDGDQLCQKLPYRSLRSGADVVDLE